MPYAQSHYPFENKKQFESTFPADFIAEGVDQTRGWYVCVCLSVYVSVCVRVWGCGCVCTRVRVCVGVYLYV